MLSISRKTYENIVASPEFCMMVAGGAAEAGGGSHAGATSEQTQENKVSSAMTH